MELGAREVFELMLGCHLVVQESAEERAFGVTAMVGLAGKLCGLLSVRCDPQTATLMASKMLDVEVDKVGSDMADALGEVCNMVAGNFKNKIAGLGDGCMLSPPTVITGTDYAMHAKANSRTLQLAMLFEGLPMLIALQIDG